MNWFARLAKRFGFARAVALALLIGLAALRIADPLPLEELRVRVFDIYQVLHPRVAKQRPVVIVDIDEKSLKTIGQWPWPRTRVAELVSKLTQMGAAAIGFDIVFAEPDRMSPGLAADSFAGTRRRNARQAACLAEQRRGAGRCHQAFACGAW